MLVALTRQCHTAPAFASVLFSSRLLQTYSSSSSSPGLFGNARLQQPGDFPQWAEEAKLRCGELVHQIVSAPPDAHVVRLVDDISNEMCQVYDSAECCRNVHSDPEWQSAASRACEVLGDFLAGINHHEGIYNKLTEVQQLYQQSIAAANSSEPADRQLQHKLLSRKQLSEFCPETLTVAHKLRQDFEKYGIHLRGSQQRADVARLLALNQHYPARFNAALADHRALGTTSVSARLVPSDLAVYASIMGKVTIPLDAGSVHSFLSSVDNEQARKQVYLAGACAPQANLSLLDDMLACRHQLARLLGYKSYAEFKAADSTLAGTPAAAESFLKDLADGCRQQADRELSKLTLIKQQHTGDMGAVLQPWDQDYYSRQLASSGPHHAAATAAAPYLQLSSVLSGLSELLQQLMGLSLSQEQISPQEAWGKGVMKFRVICNDLGPLGVLYLDLFSRPGKVPSSGILYPVRCGRELPGGGYQQPVLCLVGNLSNNSSNSRTDNDQPLTWREFRTLLHEMGHAVHSMVSRTRYQHVWGTRCSQDIVEVPSHLWEHFATHPASLALLARHKNTRNPLPDPLLQQLKQSSSVTPALELQQQALLSLVDLVYHGSDLPSDLGGTSAMWWNLAETHASLPPQPGTCPQARFSHLTIYGASYYSYLYARCLSEAVWNMQLATNPLESQAGRMVRKVLLEPGGSLEPLDLLSTALGGVDSQLKVLQQRHGGWCPNPSMLLTSIGV